MCICLPNGKFNFKFSRSHSCASKKAGKTKRPLSLISESSEDDDGRDRLSLTHKNGIKKDAFNQIHGDCSNNQGQIRQLSRDRQLPPVPDTIDFSVLQINSPRKSIGKSNSTMGKSDQFYLRQQTEDYGNVYDTEAFVTESINHMQHLPNRQCNQFPTTISEDIREIDPLYSSVLLQSNRPRSQVPKIDQIQNAKDYYSAKNDNDHLYSTIVKKDFNSLRKPSKPRPSIRDYPYQSLQSLHNQAPGLPVRLYKLSELSHLTSQTNPVYPDIKLRTSATLNSKSGSLRRFSQPNSVHNDTDREPQITEEGQRDIDVLRRIQSQYNTPPMKRASLSDVRQLQDDLDDTSTESQRLQVLDSDIPSVIPNGCRSSDNSDLYRHITVRESLASLRARNAMPGENGLLFDNVVNTEPNVLPHVYEGLYETLYYSSTDQGRPGPIIDDEPIIASSIVRPDLAMPLPYLGQDNYLSITDNAIPSSNHNNHNNSQATRQSSQDRASVIYATTGSEVYAEISDAYLSKQYEELPDQKQTAKENGQVNNGYIGSPGTLRVLLEIQSFRHMDSDVDVSSRSTTPLHPLPRSITSNNKSLATKLTDNNNIIPYSTVIRHPWFLPQRSMDTQSSIEDTNVTFKSPVAIKPKLLPQNHLAIMTPLMERSMEGSSMFLDDNRNSDQCDGDSLYDLFKRDRTSDSNSKYRQTMGQMALPEEEDNCGNRKHKRIVYPGFSNHHAVDLNDRDRPFL